MGRDGGGLETGFEPELSLEVWRISIDVPTPVSTSRRFAG
jgi:hypothetical protein